MMLKIMEESEVDERTFFEDVLRGESAQYPTEFSWFKCCLLSEFFNMSAIRLPKEVIGYIGIRRDSQTG